MSNDISFTGAKTCDHCGKEFTQDGQFDARSGEVTCPDYLGRNNDMTNDTAGEAKLQDILNDDINAFFEAYKKHSLDKPGEPFVIDSWKHSKAIKAILALIHAQNKAVVERIRVTGPFPFREPVQAPDGSIIDEYKLGYNEAVKEMYAALQAMLPTPQQETGEEDA